MSRIADRLKWAVEMLDVQPDDHILEIGCGHGIAVSLVCEKGANITAIDRSEKMIAAARNRNAAFIENGKASFNFTSLQDAELDGVTFNKIFAVNVNVFWQKPDRELRVIKNLLEANGIFHIFYQPPSSDKAYKVAADVKENLTTNGFSVTDTQFEEFDSGTAVCIRATL